jgi:hypothetical protein
MDKHKGPFELPDAVGLCPDHGKEFYVPLEVPLDSPLQWCPQPGCQRVLAIYRTTVISRPLAR